MELSHMADMIIFEQNLMLVRQAEIVLKSKWDTEETSKMFEGGSGGAAKES